MVHLALLGRRIHLRPVGLLQRTAVDPQIQGSAGNERTRRNEKAH